LHADDFGMNRSVTAGIIHGFTHGLLTSTSLLANAPDAHAALGAWRLLEGKRAGGRLPSAEARARLREPAQPFELGIHLNLTQGRPLTRGYPPQLLDDAGHFCGIGKVFRHLRRPRRRPAFDNALRSELSAQIEFLLDHGIRPTHLNGHQYIEMLPGLRETLRSLVVRYRIESLRVAREGGLWRTTLLNGLQVKNWSLAQVKRFYAGRFLQEARQWEVNFPNAFFGTSHAGRVDLRVMRQFLASGRRSELIEIGLHPATATTPGEAPTTAAWDDPLAHHRPHELALLTSPELVDLLHSRGLSLGRLAGFATTVATKAA
jgi:predicted glycoside hydrolase/deacetylase ChbG (UPF0249 family)